LKSVHNPRWRKVQRLEVSAGSLTEKLLFCEPGDDIFSSSSFEYSPSSESFGQFFSTHRDDIQAFLCTSSVLFPWSERATTKLLFECLQVAAVGNRQIQQTVMVRFAPSSWHISELVSVQSNLHRMISFCCIQRGSASWQWLKFVQNQLTCWTLMVGFWWFKILKISSLVK
jgi:hypothetical protein